MCGCYYDNDDVIGEITGELYFGTKLKCIAQILHELWLLCAEI